jgi:hypothetical protein
MGRLVLLALGMTLNPSLHLRDVEGIERYPLKVDKGHAEALFFIAEDCPISNYYSQEIRRICDAYRARGVGCSLVYVDPTLSDAAAAKHAQEYGHGAYPKIVDRNHALVEATGATITPEAVVIAPNETIAYRGRIDDSYVSLGKKRRVVTEFDLRDALDAVLTGKPASRAEVQAVGCYISPLSAYQH